MSVAYLSNTSNSQAVDTFQKKQSVTEVPCGFGLVLLHCNLGTKVDVSITYLTGEHRRKTICFQLLGLFYRLEVQTVPCELPHAVQYNLNELHAVQYITNILFFP